MIWSSFCHRCSKRKWVIKYKTYNHKLDASTKFQVFSRNTGKLSLFPKVLQGLGRKFQNTRSFPGIQGNYLFFQDFSGAIEENFKIPEVFQEYSETICYSKSFPGPWKKFQNFRSFPRIQGNYLFFQKFSRVLEENFKFPGNPEAVSTKF